MLDAHREKPHASNSSMIGGEDVWLRWWAIFAIVLPASTWRLWFADNEFPSVALFPLFEPTPWWPQWLAATAMMLAVGGCLMGRTIITPACLLAYVVSLLFLWSCNQHRLQPWAYQFGVIAAVMYFEPWRRAAPLLRMLVISIYFYSALGKFDYSFTHTLGRTLLEGALSGVGVDCGAWPESLRVVLVLCLPCVELAVALGLCFRRTGRVAAWAAMLLHAILLLRLSPWGLNHQPGVLIWNVFFMGQAWILFVASAARTGPPARSEDATPRESASARTWLGRSPASYVSGGAMLILLVVLAPLLEPWGLCDHWLAWGLYSTRNSRALVQIREPAVARLPHTIADQLSEPDGTGWLELDLGRWSLEALGAPVYPQAEFQRAVAERLRRRFKLGAEMRIRTYTMADRFTGRRRLQSE